MKLSNNKLVVSTATALLALFATTAFGQNVVTFDENGHGNVNGTQLLPSTVGLDPLSGISTLYYLSTIPVTQGDVLLFEDPTSGLPSDLVRFESVGPYTYVYFFSDKEAADLPPFDLADVNQMPVPLPNAINVLETGVEGQNGVLYTPLPNQPGSVPGAVIQYNIMSDVIVPEPSGLALVSVGGGLLLLFRRRLYSRKALN